MEFIISIQFTEMAPDTVMKYTWNISALKIQKERRKKQN